MLAEQLDATPNQLNSTKSFLIIFYGTVLLLYRTNTYGKLISLTFARFQHRIIVPTTDIQERDNNARSDQPRGSLSAVYRSKVG